MLSYTTLNNSLLQTKFESDKDNKAKTISSADLYRTLVIKLQTDATRDGKFTNYKDVTFVQLSKASGDDLRTITRFVARAKEYRYFTIKNVVDPTSIGTDFIKTRNHYYFMKDKKNYTIINNDILNIDVPQIEGKKQSDASALKGFIVQLKMACGYFNVYEIDRKEIYKKLEMSRNTINKYLLRLIELGWVTEKNKVITIRKTEFFTNDVAEEKIAESKEQSFNNLIAVIGNDPRLLGMFKGMLKRGDFEKITNPFTYFMKIVEDVKRTEFNKQIVDKENEDINTIQL